MKKYLIRFIFVDHSSDDSSPEERQIVDAEDESAACALFYANGDMGNCYINSVTLFK
jgi:hypothetical protein